MKVIMLDFDGVLNSQGSFLYESNRRKVDPTIKPRVQETLCNVCTANFQFVLDKYPDVKIVISSTWRTLFGFDWLKEKLESYDIDSSRVIDKTPDAWGRKSRGEEIQTWLNDHPEVTHYVVIDDNDDDISLIHGKHRFVLTTWDGGMTFAHATELIEKLKKTSKKKVKK